MVMKKIDSHIVENIQAAKVFVKNLLFPRHLKLDLFVANLDGLVMAIRGKNTFILPEDQVFEQLNEPTFTR